MDQRERFIAAMAPLPCNWSERDTKFTDAGVQLAWHAWQAAEAAALERALPEGWKLVPVDPTEAMIEAAGETIYGHPREKAIEWAKSDKFESAENQGADVYRAMLNAAAAAPGAGD